MDLRLGEQQRRGSGLPAAGLLCLGMTPEEQLGRNLKSTIWLGEVGAAFRQMPFQGGGPEGAQTLIWKRPPFARSTLKSLLWSYRLFLIFCPTPPLTRDEKSFPCLSTTMA